MSHERGMLEIRLCKIWDGYVRGSSNTFVVLRDIVSEIQKVQAFCEGRASPKMREALEYYLAALEDCSDAVQEGMVSKELMLGRIPPKQQALVRQSDQLLLVIPEQLADLRRDLG